MSARLPSPPLSFLVTRVPIPVLSFSRGSSLLLVPSLFSGFSGFPPSTKTNTSKFQFDLYVGCLNTSPWLGKPLPTLTLNEVYIFYFFNVIFLSFVLVASLRVIRSFLILRVLTMLFPQPVQPAPMLLAMLSE